MVYFARIGEDGPIKIGHSNRVDDRLKQLHSIYGRRMELLGTIPGGQAEERAMHERFAEHRIEGTEQFRPGRDLMGFLGRPLLVGANPEAVEAIAKLKPLHSVRLSDRVVEMARMVAADKAEGIGDTISRLVEPGLEAEYRQVMEARYRAMTPAPAPPKAPAGAGPGRDLPAPGKAPGKKAPRKSQRGGAE